MKFSLGDKVIIKNDYNLYNSPGYIEFNMIPPYIKYCGKIATIIECRCISADDIFPEEHLYLLDIDNGTLLWMEKYLDNTVQYRKNLINKINQALDEDDEIMFYKLSRKYKQLLTSQT